MNHHPKCRVCGRTVEYFGDYCPDDQPVGDEPDALIELTNADTRRLAERGVQ